MFATLVGLLGFTSQLSNPVAVAITAVVDAMDRFVPCLSNLKECLGLWLLALICCRKDTQGDRSDDEREVLGLFISPGS